MRELEEAPRRTPAFSELLSSLYDSGSFSSLSLAGASVVAGRGQVGGRYARFAATDARVARGAFGVADCKVLQQLFLDARNEGEPVILLLDSAGVRVDQGLPALGAFRAAYRAAIDCRLSGVPMLACVGHDCFGGASMLASLAEQRVFSRTARFGLSGPRVIEAMGGRDQLNADDPAAVAALMGAQARSRWHAADSVVDLNLAQLRRIISTWIASPVRHQNAGLLRAHLRLAARLRDAGIMQDTEQSALVTTDIRAFASTRNPTDVLKLIDGKTPAYVGMTSRNAVGALDCWSLADVLLDLTERDPGRPVLVALDVPGHRATRSDEEVMLTEFVAHVALVMATLRVTGHRVTLLLAGKASGAIYAALSAGADEVVALKTAEVRVLPPQAVARITGTRPSVAPVDLLQSGVADRMLGDVWN